MLYKKIELYPKTWIKTPLESDTILWYVFAFGFVQDNNEIIEIFEDYKNWNLPFVITNWFLSSKNEVFVPRPIYFDTRWEKQVNPDDDLKKGIENESVRKKKKKVSLIKFTHLKKYLSNKQEEILDNVIQVDFDDIVQQDVVWKNAIPRFHTADTNPFAENAEFAKKYTIYVKIFDEEKFNKFFDFIKNLFETIGFWAGKSRWFWKFEKIKLSDLTDQEKEILNFVEENKKQGNYLVLNNYKPTNEELEIMDFDSSYIDINWKNTKTIQEFNENFFKWNMNFIKEWSFIRVKSEENLKKSEEKIIWSYYESWGSYNFGYLF